jgi:hypothetical protein
MLDGISDIARGIQTSQPGGLVFSQMMEELGAKASPIRRLELLTPRVHKLADREDVRRAVKLLRKAAIASRQRNWTRSYTMVRLALEAVGRDKQLLRELMKIHSLTFIIIPRRPVARDRYGLVDARLTMVKDPWPPRLGFVP